MNKTNIEWVKNPDGTQGYTFNPITGCLNHTPEGLCLGGGFPCYAYRLANGRLRERYLANTHLAPHIPEDVNILPTDPFYPRFWQNRIQEQFGACTSGAESKGIFVCDMGDLFGRGVPEAWTRRILSKIGMSWYREHRFYLLTKQPQNLGKFSPFPDNCWVGVTATNTKAFIEAHKYLCKIEAAVTFVSFEPLLERVEPYDELLLTPYLSECCDWVIIGAQTKPYKPPKIEWVEEIVKAADQAGISVFLKNNLYPLLGSGNGKSICHNNEVGTLKQEMPEPEREK